MPSPTGPDFAPHDLTSKTSHSPFVVSCRSEATVFGPFDCWKAFDGTDGYWLGTLGGHDDWLEIDLGVGNEKILGSYGIKVNTIPEATRAPRDWFMQGSNDDSTWATLDTVNSETGWGSGETRTYICDTAATAYRYFRIWINANNGDGTFTQINELYLYTGVAPAPGKSGRVFARDGTGGAQLTGSPIVPVVRDPLSTLKPEGQIITRRWYQLIRDLTISSGAEMIYGSLADMADLDAKVLDGALFVVADYNNVVYQWRGTAWVYISGIVQCNQADLSGLASVLDVNSTGLLAEVVDYGHTLRWTGSGWEAGPGTWDAGMIAYFDSDPGTCWAICDGSPVTILKPDGTTRSWAVHPDLTAGVYLKGGASYTGTVTAAVNPSFTGSALAAHSHDSPLGVDVNNNPHVLNVNGTGGSYAGVRSQAFGSDTSSASSLKTTATSAGTPAGTVSLVGDPVKNMAAMPYIRR